MWLNKELEAEFAKRRKLIERARKGDRAARLKLFDLYRVWINPGPETAAGEA